MKRLFGASAVFNHATVRFGALEPTCEVDEYGNTKTEKKVIELTIQIDRIGTAQGNLAENEAQSMDNRVMEGHLIRPDKMPESIQPGLIGEIFFKDGTKDACQVMPVTQISWSIVNVRRIKLKVGTGTLVRLV